MNNLVYTKTIEMYGTDCLITKDAHIVAIRDDSNDIIGYVATCSTIYRGYMGFETKCMSFVYEAYQEDEALDCCENFINVSFIDDEVQE